MSWDVAWPSAPGEVLLWSQTLLAWNCAAYVAVSGPVGRQAMLSHPPDTPGPGRRRVPWRILAAAILIGLLPGWVTVSWQARLGLAAFAAGLLAALPRGRRWLAHGPPSRHGLLAEWELAANGLFIAASGIVIGHARLAVVKPLVRLPTSPERVAAVCLCGAAVAFVLRGGTHVVRGVLDKTGTLPLQPAAADTISHGAAGESPVASSTSAPGEEQAQRVDVPEYNRGRTIGHLERLIMTAAAMLGSYEALGLIIAAKGLIRAKEFEDRDFAEYFIMGSLASTAVALGVGLALRAAVARLWVP